MLVGCERAVFQQAAFASVEVFVPATQSRSHPAPQSCWCIGMPETCQHCGGQMSVRSMHPASAPSSACPEACTASPPPPLWQAPGRPSPASHPWAGGSALSAAIAGCAGCACMCWALGWRLQLLAYACNAAQRSLATSLKGHLYFTPCLRSASAPQSSLTRFALGASPCVAASASAQGRLDGMAMRSGMLPSSS